MDKTTYYRIINKIKIKEKVDIDLDYNEYLVYIEMIKEKINYKNKIYIANKITKVLFDLGELSIIIWGLFGLATVDFLGIKDKEKVCLMFHSMTTQISNNILAILILCNNSLDMQSGILIRSTCELCYMLLAILINRDKRRKYLEAAQTDNQLKIWNEEFKFRQLNEEIKNFENKITNNDKFVKDMLSNFRKNLYIHYSEYTHSSLLTCLIHSYDYTEASNKPLYYNLWGEKSTRLKKYLTTLFELNFFTFLDLFSILTKKINLRKFLGDDELKQKLWNNAGYFFLIFKEYYYENIYLFNY